MKKPWAVAGIVVKELYRRKDFYVLFILTALLTLLAGSITVFNDDRIVRYLKEICLLLIWISSLVIAISTAARQIPAERENRTILPLLAKPISRWEVLLGKFFGCWIASGLALVCFYFFFGLVAASREQSWPILQYLQAFALHEFMLGIVIAFTLLGSVLLSTPSATITIAFILVLGILFIARHLNRIALSLPELPGTIVYAVYYLIPHLEFFDLRAMLIHQTTLVPWLHWSLAILYAVAYTACFLVGTWVVFRKQPVN